MNGDGLVRGVGYKCARLSLGRNDVGSAGHRCRSRDGFHVSIITSVDVITTKQGTAFNMGSVIMAKCNWQRIVLTAV